MVWIFGVRTYCLFIPENTHLFSIKGEVDLDQLNIPPKAPISWASVPLWDYGDDGWDEVQKCLAYRKLLINFYCMCFFFGGVVPLI